MLTPVQLVWSIFSAIILLSIFAFLRNDAHSLFKCHYKSLFLIIAISIVSKLPFDFNFFYGLEYEDAYIFTGYSRFLLYNNFFSVDPFQTKACLFGSLKYCEIVGTYGGHFLGLSSLGYFFNKYFGYSPLIICFINFFASLIAACLIYCVSYLLSEDKQIGIMCSLIYSLSPAMSLFHTSGLAETLSSTSIIFTLFLFLLIFEKRKNLDRPNEAILWLLLLLSFSFCLLQKRENLILLFLPLISLLRILIDHKYNSYIIIRITIFMILGVAILTVFHYGINVFDIERQESQEIAKATFSLKYFISLAPVFIKSFLTFQWFFVFSIFTFAGLILISINIKQHPLYVYPIMLLIAYLLAYTLHYRSYYFIKYGHVNEFESLRYITNFFPFYCLIGGYAIVNVFNPLKNKLKLPKYYLSVLSILVIGYLIYANVILKKEFFLIEQENRIAPVKETIRLVDSRGNIIITDVPLIFQVLGKETLQIVKNPAAETAGRQSQNSNSLICSRSFPPTALHTSELRQRPQGVIVINFPSIGKGINISDIKNKMDKSQNIYYLKRLTDNDGYQYERYPAAIKYINSLALVKVKEFKSDRFALYKINP